MIALLLLLAVGGLMQAARSFSTDIAAAGTELGFGFLLLAAYFMAKVLSRFGLPKLTGYLLAGVVAGPFVLDLLTKPMTESLSIINGVATCILGLTAGAELNLKKVRPLMRTLRGYMVFGVFGAMIVLGGVLFLIRPLLPWLYGADLAQSLAICMVIAVALTPQSPAIVLALLSETQADGPLSQVMLATVVVADLVVILCYAVAAALTGAVIGGEIHVPELVLSVSWELGGSIVFGIAMGAVIGAFLKSVKNGAPLFALLICVVVAQIASKVSLDPLVVMLAAGIWLENFSRADATALLHEFESAQLPVFLVWFALSGTSLNIFKLWAAIVPVLILAASRAVAFFFGCRIASVRSQASAAITSFGWIGLVPQAGLSLALVIVIPHNFPTFGPQAAVLMLSLIGVNQLVAPVLLRIALIRSGEAGRKARVDFAAGGH